MKATILNLDAETVGEIELSDEVFGLEVRADILARTVNWQLNKRRQGTHATKGVSDVAGRKQKPYRQKGTGRARQGSVRSAQFRGGGVVFGPLPRSHATDLPKKVRKLALKTALSSKAGEGKLVVLEAAKSDSHKTKLLVERFGKLGLANALIIDGANLDENFVRAARNIPLIDVLPEQGANVYDILRHDTLVLTRNAVEQLEARLK